MECDATARERADVWRVDRAIVAGVAVKPRVAEVELVDAHVVDEEDEEIGPRRRRPGRRRHRERRGHRGVGAVNHSL